MQFSTDIANSAAIYIRENKYLSEKAKINFLKNPFEQPTPEKSLLSEERISKKVDFNLCDELVHTNYYCTISIFLQNVSDH